MSDIASTTEYDVLYDEKINAKSCIEKNINSERLFKIIDEVPQLPPTESKKEKKMKPKKVSDSKNKTTVLKRSVIMSQVISEL